MPACNGQREDPHAANGCEVGPLHTRAGELAIAFAAMLEERGGVAARSWLDAELWRGYSAIVCAWREREEDGGELSESRCAVGHGEGS